MNKQEFLDRLRGELSILPSADTEERINFYSEMIDDRMEEGVSEEDAVAEIGSIESVVEQIIADMPQAPKKRKIKGWEILLLALGSPLWISLGIAAAAVIFSVYVSLWAVIISLWAVFGAVAACAVGSIPACVALCVGGHILSGITVLAAGIVCAGLSIFAFFGCKLATKGTVKLTKLCVKRLFRKKEEA
ncbi:MAG: DUF1700 domain-containing protein [Clostridia bacterium]|nr:DUF1700 domain-containing protein [Clostridia bacterium]